MKSIYRGLRIVFEGGDAAGKNTQAHALLTNLLSRGEDAMVFSFPQYATDVGQLIHRFLTKKVFLASTSPDRDHKEVARQDAEVLQALMFFDRAHGYMEMETWLRRGSHVICDRLWPSSLYGKFAAGLEADSTPIEGALLPADLYILLDLPAEQAIARRPIPRDRYEESLELRQRVRAAYQELWAKMGLKEDGENIAAGLSFGNSPPSRWRTIDASLPTAEVSSQADTIVAHFMTSNERYPSR